ncbi:MAG: hypothetical protein ACHQ53_03665 [Polyangiales bacterium]
MTRKLAAAILCGACCALGSACQSPAQSAQKLAPRDGVSYAAHVQPYLELTCATLDCHGNRGRALRLYSELGLRASDDLRPQPISMTTEPSAITQDELDANVLSFAGVAVEAKRPSQQLALLKPLAVSAGGVKHVGGVHWLSTKDPGYSCMREWLVGDVQGDLGDFCARALDAIKPPGM